MWSFYFFIASRRPRRPPETFLEPVAPFSQSMSPYRPTTTPFIPKITLFLCSCHTHHRPIFVTDPNFLWLNLPIYSPSKFLGRFRRLRKTLLCRHFILENSRYSGKSNYFIFRWQTYKNNKNQGGAFSDVSYKNTIYLQKTDNISSENRQYMFRQETMYLLGNQQSSFTKG